MSKKATPATLLEAIRYFSDPEVCVEYVAKLRWPHGPVCPRCDGIEHSYLTTRRLWKCKGCKKQFSVKLGTIFEDSPIGLDKWLAAVWLIANSKNGVSSHKLGRTIGVTQKSAWFVLHRIRLAMQSGRFDKLDGEVEVDETFIGGKARNMHKAERAGKITGTGGKDKAVVVGTKERGGEVWAAVDQGVDLVHFAKGQRKDDVAKTYLADNDGPRACSCRPGPGEDLDASHRAPGEPDHRQRLSLD